MKKPTGTAEIPLNVVRAKELLDKIRDREVIGCTETFGGFDSDDEEEGESDSRFWAFCCQISWGNLTVPPD